MLINTLKMLVMAGKNALGTTCGLPVIDEEITQIRHGNITFPSLGEISFSGSTLQKIQLGCDTQLCGQLAENLDGSSGTSGMEVLAQRFLDNVLEDMEGRWPKGWVDSMDLGPVSLHSRGVRSFGVRLQTENGQFYLMTEVPSKAELELSHNEGYLNTMARNYLPREWFNLTTIDLASDIENFLVFLRKTEVDVQIDVPADDDYYTLHTGILIENTTRNDRRVMRLSMDVSGPEGKALSVNDKVNVRVGLYGGALTFESTFLGTSQYRVTESASINCIDIAWPAKLNIEQRRRAFRIDPAERIPVVIQSQGSPEESNPWSLNTESETKVRGRLADLSFSGARIIASRNSLLGTFDEGSRISCRFFFPDEEEDYKVVGIIRRATISLADQDTQQDEVGIEFLVDENSDRSSLEYIRQYVLSKQRAWLAQRVHVSGVEQW